VKVCPSKFEATRSPVSNRLQRSGDSGSVMMGAHEWKPAKLNELGFVGRGKSRHRPRNAAFLYGGRYPFFQTGDIKAANFTLTEHTQTYSEEGLAQSKLWKPGTLCITIAANIAESAILGIEGCFPDSVVGFVADSNKADVRFVKYYMEILKLQMQSMSRGTTQDNLSLDKLLTFDFLVPPLSVQRRIAGILSAYDELIENNLKRIKILEEMARSLYREWFVYFRFPGYEKVKFVDSPLGKIPQGWKVKPIEAFCSLVTRGVTPKYELGSGRFVINQKVNRGSELSLDDLKELEAGLEVPPEKIARFGDVLVNCLGEGTIGRVHFYTEIHQNWAVDQHMSICRAPNVADALYVYFALESEEGQGRIVSLKTGGTNMTMFNISALRLFAVIAPPTGLLLRFSELVLPMFRQKQALIELNRNLRRTRDLLLPRLISGQLELS